MYFTSDDGSQNMFFLSTIIWYVRVKKDKGTDYVLSWKSKGVFTSKRKPLFNSFLHNIKLSGYKVGINL